MLTRVINLTILIHNFDNLNGFTKLMVIFEPYEEIIFFCNIVFNNIQNEIFKYCYSKIQTYNIFFNCKIKNYKIPLQKIKKEILIVVIEILYQKNLLQINYSNNVIRFLRKNVVHIFVITFYTM